MPVDSFFGGLGSERVFEVPYKDRMIVISVCFQIDDKHSLVTEEIIQQFAPPNTHNVDIDVKLESWLVGYVKFVVVQNMPQV